MAARSPVRGLAVGDLVDILGGGLFSLLAGSPRTEVDDVTIAEPATGVLGQAGDLLLGVGIDGTEAAIALMAKAKAVGSGAVVLRRAVADQPEVLRAARADRLALLGLADQASWAHVVWLVRAVLDRVPADPTRPEELRIQDELFVFADACAAVVDAPVTIEDTRSRVLAHSARHDAADPIRLTTIVGRRVPDTVLASLRARGVFRRLAASDEPFFVPADGDLRARLVVPVRAGTEWLGSIWAVVDDRPAPEVVAELTRTAARVALHLLQLRSQVDLRRRVAADRVRAALHGSGDGVGWLPPPPWRVVLLGGLADPVASRVGLWEAAARRALWRQPIIVDVAEDVVAVVRDPEAHAQPCGHLEPGTAAWLDDLATELNAAVGRISAHAGHAVNRVESLPDSLAAARSVRQVSGDAVVVHLEDVWAQLVLARAVDAVRDGIPDPVDALLAHDVEHDSDLAGTLAAWLTHPAAPRVAAQQLHIHPNTLRYRMVRVREVLDADPDDPDTRLALALRLRAALPLARLSG